MADPSDKLSSATQSDSPQTSPSDNLSATSVSNSTNSTSVFDEAVEQFIRLYDGPEVKIKFDEIDEYFMHRKIKEIIDTIPQLRMGNLREWYNMTSWILREDPIFRCLTCPHEIEYEDEFQYDLCHRLSKLFCNSLRIKAEEEEVIDMLRGRDARWILKHIKSRVEMLEREKRAERFDRSMIGTRSLSVSKQESIKDLFEKTHTEGKNLVYADVYGLIASSVIGVIFEYKMKDGNLPYATERFKYLLLKKIEAEKLIDDGKALLNPKYYLDLLFEFTYDNVNFASNNPKVFHDTGRSGAPISSPNKKTPMKLSPGEERKREFHLDPEIFARLRDQCKDLPSKRNQFLVDVELKGKFSIGEIAAIYKGAKFCIFCRKHRINVYQHKCGE
ncbi:hypothetical protein Kpol_1018p146 [Vanderwaltozyma polyspora DSM 70294]|uniref:Uncharacterized protein n=1 Tax=Vanderwaltozyma polyspora (strain ATCC 22028 / DSM 70294 / BCRC 21397 / CBS 2163 / NBRC 10782 / NRRL Y-8283 / UCD 57-17) TaxID=436907 RepID=A7TDY8_VANPO|nr:uncharacterized protein Kpol_1018p146 [Vanderwaltozyma polyspora DSM 70294]EDO19608.1 hypothetical protein Kpol_1018p146 [Vanderwaltozyma polyspora DSM 70294]